MSDVTEHEHDSLPVAMGPVRALLEQGIAFVYTADREGRLVSVSEGVERILGFAPDELIGTTPLEAVGRKTRDGPPWRCSTGFPGTAPCSSTRSRGSRGTDR